MALLDAAYLLSTIRALLNEISPDHWTDDQINKWVQEAAMDISIKTMGYESKGEISTIVDTLEYDEPSNCIKAHSVIIGPTYSTTTKTWGENSGDDYSGMKDCLIYKAIVQNDDGVYIAVGCGSGDPNKINRTVIQFDIKSDLEALGAVSITSANLYLKGYSMNGSHTVSAYRVLQNWGETTVTWVTPWNTAGCAAASDAGEDDGVYDRKATAENSDSTHTVGAYDTVLDLTSLAQAWFAGTAKEYGVLLQSDNEAVGNWLRWYQSEDAEGSKPYLEIVYAMGVATGRHKGLTRIHPRLINHVPHNISGEPIHYYHHHDKIGIWPLADTVYGVNVYFSKVTDDITDLPTELRLLAIPYCLAMARLSLAQKPEFDMLITMYLNSVIAHRRDRGQYKLGIIDSKDMFEIPEGNVTNA
jgi:hypothetical protein